MNRAVVEADPRAVGKAFVAQAADERPLPCVDANVNLERSGLGETLPALATAVGLLPRVSPLVGPDTSEVRKPPATEATGIWPFTCVNPPMNLQSTRLAETLPALRAGVGPGTCMHVEVYAEVAVRVESPTALGAEKAGRFLSVFRALMLQQLRRSWKGGSAVHAAMQRQHGRSRPASFIWLLWLPDLMMAHLGTGGTGGTRPLAAQGREGTRQL